MQPVRKKIAMLKIDLYEFIEILSL